MFLLGGIADNNYLDNKIDRIELDTQSYIRTMKQIENVQENKFQEFEKYFTKYRENKTIAVINSPKKVISFGSIASPKNKIKARFNFGPVGKETNERNERSRRIAEEEIVQLEEEYELSETEKKKFGGNEKMG